jgi:flagellar hook-length control protein FliK
LQGQPQAAAANTAAPDHGKVVEACKTGQKQNGRREPASTASTQAGKLNQTQTAHGDAAVRIVAADGAASAHSQTTAAEGPANQASDHPLLKAAEASVQSTSRGTPQAGLTQQAAETPVADQIVQSIRAAGARVNQQIVVNLTPPELGKVRVTLRSSGHEIRGVLEADNPDTLRRLEREAAGLTQRLGDAGLDVRRMDVVMTRQDGQATSQNPHARDGSRQHPDAGSDSTSRAAPASGQGSPEETSAAGLDVVTSGSINVRI